MVARVRGVDFYGHDSRVRLALSDGATVSARVDGADLPAVGDDVVVTVRGIALAFPVDAAGRSAPLQPSV
ncbi:TOBE domain-containing protein [Blastococcus brunescens]|uniref:TOBE domain-containing protein n=1 Tax=Blastococcus brunescens TaxID=1564165 RepID=A0ABZ1AZ64_9ACTN|nr:TOBE domain-containing protein [Blastococcus sp. BMG 8361]WRL62095.1 TOBE domain-containing protein [Blastococcus sp. BMG 8361]